MIIIIAVTAKPTANDILTLKTDDLINGDLILNLYNANGSLVKERILTQNQTQIDVGDLNNGIYMLIVRSGNGIVSKRLVIQR